MRRARSLDDAVTRILCHLLRHDPEAYGVAVDQHGWAEISSVLGATGEKLRALCAWRKPRVEDLHRISDGSFPRRFQIEGSRIRALYGHSLGTVEVGVVRKPPVHLFHGTSADVLPVIRDLGLIPVHRQYVHLTSDAEYAGRVAVAKSHLPVLLRIQCEAAACGGVIFRQANSEVWLATPVLPEFIEGDRLQRAFNTWHSAGFRPQSIRCLLDRWHSKAPS